MARNTPHFLLKLKTLPLVIGVSPFLWSQPATATLLYLHFLFFVETNHTQWECTHLSHTRQAPYLDYPY